MRAGDGISKYNYEWPALAVAPRFGAAYDVSGRQSLIVRGGVGLFFDRPDGDSIYYQSQNPPTSTNQTVRNGRCRRWARHRRGELRRADDHRLPLRQPEPARRHSSGTPGMQMTLPWSSSLDIAYVGQHAFHVLNAFQSNTAVNINAIDFGAAFLPQNQDPTRSAAVTAVAGSGAYVQELLRPIRGYANIDQQWQDFERTYHSMQFSATRRFRNGVSFGGNYTLSLSDNGTTGVPLRLQHNADGSFFIREDQAIFNELMKNQGLQRHIVKANFIWDLPDWQTTEPSRIAAAVVNDWQLSASSPAAPAPATTSPISTRTTVRT